MWGPNIKLASQTDISQLELGKVGGNFTVDFKGSGLPIQDDGLVQLYIRKASVDLWRLLEETKRRVPFITGCPGVGKSMEVYAYAMYEATERKKRVLYIHGNKSKHHYLFTSGGVEDARIGISDRIVEQDTALYRFVYNQLVEQKVDMIVLDGALEWLIGKVFFKLKKFPNVRLISCTSFQAV